MSVNQFSERKDEQSGHFADFLFTSQQGGQGCSPSSGSSNRIMDGRSDSDWRNKVASAINRKEPSERRSIKVRFGSLVTPFEANFVVIQSRSRLQLGRSFREGEGLRAIGESL